MGTKIVNKIFVNQLAFPKKLSLETPNLLK